MSILMRVKYESLRWTLLSELDIYNWEQQASWSPVPLNVGVDCGDACQERGDSGVPSTSAPMYSFLNTLENNRHDFYVPCRTDVSVFELCKVKHLYPWFEYEREQYILNEDIILFQRKLGSFSALFASVVLEQSLVWIFPHSVENGIN